MSVASQFFPGGGKPRRLIFRRIVRSSEVVSCPPGYYDIIAIGTGGSGARAYGTNVRATGGGGPAWARDWGEFDVRTDVTVTIGARASGLAQTTTSANGNDGGTTTVTGIADPITLTGGKGGKSAAALATQTGGDGGVATGGKIRANGSRGGDITSTATGEKATGGGAVDLFLSGTNKTRGGDVVGSGTGSQATGGGGVGGRAGDVNAGPQATSGGGSGGDALDGLYSSTTNGPNMVGDRTPAAVPADAQVAEILLSFPALTPTGAGNQGATPSGAGSAASISASTGAAQLGATGAAVASTAILSGESVIGGGTGATASNNSAVGTGAAGAAYVVISVYVETA